MRILRMKQISLINDNKIRKIRVIRIEKKGIMLTHNPFLWMKLSKPIYPFRRISMRSATPWVAGFSMTVTQSGTAAGLGSM